MLNKLHQLREERDDQGFTLIELLVVVVIIGILIAIAIPLYLNYQKGAKNKSAASDVRNSIAALEQCYTDNGNKYPVTVAIRGTSFKVGCGTGQTSQAINISSGNSVGYIHNSTGYVVVSHAGSPGDKGSCYNSTKGGSVSSVGNTAALSMTAC